MQTVSEEWFCYKGVKKKDKKDEETQRAQNASI